MNLYLVCRFRAFGLLCVLKFRFWDVGIGLQIVNWCLVLGKFILCDFFHFSVSGFCGFGSLNWFALWANVGVYGFWVFQVTDNWAQ